MTIFKRKLYSELLKWKEESEGNSALMIQGARRVGKSTLAEEFAKNEYRSYILIDFSIASEEIKELFNHMYDLKYFFRMLQFYTSQELFDRESLIIFDEVQLYPLARQAIKTLVKDHRFDYIETGSLLSIKRNVKDILIPSEERTIEMYPMDYEEFCWATGSTATYELAKEMFLCGKSYGDKVHRQLMRNFRLYMIVGGMPAVVSRFLETENFEKVDQEKRLILGLYENDFRKIDGTGLASILFRNIPAELNKNTSRYQVSSVSPGKRASSILSHVAEMESSKSVLVAYHSNDPSVGQSQNIDLEVFKLYLGDTGLFVTLCFKDKAFVDNVIYEKLLGDKLSANLGYVYENVVAQMLAAKGERLFYHTFRSENSHHSYEVDFLLSRGTKVCPIEVKSSSNTQHKSLDMFCDKFSRNILSKYLVCTKEMKKEGSLQYIPFYMVPFL